MSSVGFSELIILFLIGLIVLGPERLPRVANQLGTWLGQARRMTRVMKRQLEDELSLEEKQSKFQSASVDKPAYVKPVNEKDDNYSPDHGPDEPGSGVGDDPPLEESVAIRDDGKNLEDDVSSAMPPVTTAEKEKAT